MRVVVEISKWGFVKYRFSGGVFVRDFVSPFPCLFNYGFVCGVAPDGEGRDALVLGPRLRRGSELDYAIAGYVKFVDMGKEDNKLVLSQNGKISWFERLKIRVFFTAYSIFKRFRYFVCGIKLNSCEYKGLIVNDTQW
jgi:inorganic pyrophosphatase